MAFILNIKCNSENEMKSLRQRIASSLTGSHCAVFDLQADALTLSIGEAGCNDIELDVHSSDLLKR